MQKEISYLREENKAKSETIRILSDKQNTYRCLYKNTTNTLVPEKQTIDQDTIPTKPTKTTDSWTNTDISKSKTDHASQDGNSLIISQLHHPSREKKPKHIKQNQSREICDKTKKLNLNFLMLLTENEFSFWSKHLKNVNVPLETLQHRTTNEYVGISYDMTDRDVNFLM